jgi:methyltransferase (TIGR00027 family)
MADELEAGMVALRASLLEARTGMVAPYARLFVTKKMRARAAVSAARDPDRVSANLHRFAYVSRWMERAADRFPQMIVLGAGYDTRGLWLPRIVKRSIHVIEVDLPDLIERKTATLADHGIAYPQRVAAIGFDLTDAALPDRLRRAGFSHRQPVGLVMEGLVFQLPADAVVRLLDFRWLGLAPGSEVIFDFWTNERIERRNAVLGGPPRPGEFPFPGEPAALAASLEARGYCNVRVTPIEDLVKEKVEGQSLEGWTLVEATVAD